MAVRFLDASRPRASVLIACWPGMGHVGILAARYLREKLGGHPYADIDSTALFQPEAIDVKDGIGRIQLPPAQRLYYVTEPPVIIFEGDTQLNGAAGLSVAGEVLDAVKPAGVEAVYTGAAFATPMSVKQESHVYGVATTEQLRSGFAGLQVEPLSEGRISGLNGLLLGLAQSRMLSAACFLATMPQYALESPNPKASKALVRVFERILNTTVDMTDMNRRIREADRLMGDFETRVAEAIQALQRGASRIVQDEGEEGEQQESAPEERPEPHVLMQRIERMFDAAQRDRSEAAALKEELDRWNLFGLYEDRFLDLFSHTDKT